MSMNMTVAGHDLAISRPEKVLFPDIGVTKHDVADYYERIAEIMLPHIRDRALTLHRFPDGIKPSSHSAGQGEKGSAEQGFFQQAALDGAPSFVGSTSLPMARGGLKRRNYCDNAACLAFLADQAVLAIHVWLSKTDLPRQPDRVVFDLDPGTYNGKDVLLAARLLHDLLPELGLTPYPMTTGSRGLHIVVPLRREQEFDTVRRFAERVAGLIVHHAPKRLTTHQRKDQRKGRLFLDTTRNAYGQTAVAPYSLRALPGAPVATPLDWKELDNGPFYAQSYTLKNIFRRLGQKEDSMRDLHSNAVSLEKTREPLERMLRDAGIQP